MKNVFLTIKLLAITTILSILIGCTHMTNTNPGAPILGGLELDLVKKAEIIDDIEGYGNQTTILWFIKLGDKNYGKIVPVRLGGPDTARDILSLSALTMGPRRNATGAAIYDCIQDAWSKDADLILPLATTTNVTNYFVYKKETATVKGKALKILK